MALAQMSLDQMAPGRMAAPGRHPEFVANRRFQDVALFVMLNYGRIPRGKNKTIVRIREI
jgi:hypothetical protein